MTIAEIVRKLDKVTKTARGFKACCPAHEDKHPSLDVDEADDGKILLTCRSRGCSPESICNAVGLEMSDLFPLKSAANGSTQKPRIVQTYDYTDESGALLFQAVRFEPKDFKQRQPDASKPDGWNWSVKGVRPVPYRLPELIAGVVKGTPIFICEGEKDCDAMHRAGLLATCNAGGAGKWKPEFSAHFAGAVVCVIGDKDDAGRKHAQAVAANLHPVASRVCVIELPDVNGAKVKDAADYLNASGLAAGIVTLATEAPAWTPQATTADASDAADIRGQIIAILTDKNLKSREQRDGIAAAVVDTMSKRGQLYFHAERRDFSTAMFFDGERKRLERIQGDSFVAWLGGWTGINRADPLFAAVASAVETAALDESRAKAILPEAYFVQRESGIYISNGDAELCRVSPHKVETLPNGTDGVLFCAGRTLRPWRLTEPRDFFETCRLFADIQDAAPNARELVRLWTLSLPTNPRSKPPLCLFGEVGSGKTRLALGICELYGLPPTAAKVEERLEGDFWPTVDAGGLFILDNADSRTKWLADAVAAAATGGSVSRRRLYTDNEIVPLRARAWLAITSANPTFGNDSGLADRLLVVRVRRREGTTGDAAIADEIAEHRDAALSFVAHTLAAALADATPTPDNLNARHPDFAAFSVRIGRALDREPQAIAALSAAETDKSLFCLQNDTLGAALLAHHFTAPLEGDAGELRTALAANDSALSDWSNKSFGRRLSALWPHVAAAFDAKRTEVRGGWKFRVTRRPNAPLHL